MEMSAKNRSKRLIVSLGSVMILLALLLQACQPAPAPTPAVPAATQAPEAAASQPPAEPQQTAAAQPEATAATEAPVAETAAKPGKLVIVIGEEPPNLDPGEGTIIALNTYRNTYEALVTRDAATGEIIPELALSWEATNETTWRFKLREGVKFHDGEPFNAEAAAWMLNYLYNPDNNKHILGTVPAGTTATAVDEYTLDVTTPEPFPVLKSNTSGGRKGPCAAQWLIPARLTSLRQWVPAIQPLVTLSPSTSPRRRSSAWICPTHR